MKKIIFILFLSISLLSFSQENSTDATHIKTIIFKPLAINKYAPIVSLNETLLLKFDDLNANETDYYYQIEHCDENWNPSNILETEYINGYAKDRIKNYENSFNTLQNYTHYTLTIPNEYTKLKISGNYLLTVFDEENNPVFTRKFVVYQPKVTVGAAVYKSRDLTFVQTKQAVEFFINHPNFRINNPAKEIIPIILQNNNWQTEIRGLKPQFYRGTQILYKYNKETSFWAGNEFLFFDTKSIRHTSLNIARVTDEENLYHTHLYPNQQRAYKPYTLNPDINGNFVVRILNNDNPNTEADYSVVHFSLETIDNFENKDIYVTGAFNNWALTPENKLKFNTSTERYETSFLLKQGFYNYKFVTVEKDNSINNYDIDGSYFQTENDYTVLIYYKKTGSRYTEVIGVGYANSKKLNN